MCIRDRLNAILNYRGGSLEGATIYVTLFPCNECAKAIIQSGIRRKMCIRDSGKALCIIGARQIGKTTLIREFGKNEYEYFAELNLSLIHIFASWTQLYRP